MAVFDVNDGLVSNLILVLDVAATDVELHVAPPTGISGLLASTLSMGASEWVSVRSQHELFDTSIPDPDTHQAVPDLGVNANELALVFHTHGRSGEETGRYARQAFVRLARSTDGKSSAIAIRAVLGGSPRSDDAGDQVGTSVETALPSFCFFAASVFFLLIPHLLDMTSPTAIAVMVVIVGVALLLTGGVAGVLSGQSPTPRAPHQPIVGYDTADVTYLLGWLFGTSVT